MDVASLVFLRGLFEKSFSWKKKEVFIQNLK